MADDQPLPVGTVTFFFTDIEGSTRLWQADAEAMSGALAVHDELLGSVVRRGGGHVFKHTGDGVCAVFTSPQRAVEAAFAAQESLTLPVRIGLNTGEAEQRDGDYFGAALNRCARIMDAGHGGQILASGATRSMLEEVEVRDLGQYRLKGLPAKERIFQIGAGDYPALRVEDSQSLPRARSSFVGRDTLVADIMAQLGETQLVTLVGIGGIGKTRAAIAAAGQLTSGFERTVFVDLGLASDELDVLPTFARALGVPNPTLDTVAMSASSSETLLVVDNCEHVLDTAAEIIEAVVEPSAATRVLATSREALVVEGEVLIPVTGLAGNGLDSPAVQLFVDRARAISPDFRLDSETGQTVGELCARLDHLPLAIELAAARVNTMSPAELLDRLDNRFSVLTGGRRRRRRDRHQTLRQAIDWSFDLLDPTEQGVFVRLAAFAGEFDLAGAAAVNSDASDVEVLDVLSALVDKSLLSVVRAGSQTRYRYLETIRSYAEENLERSDESEIVMGNLHEYLARFVEEVIHDAWSPTAMDSLRRLREQAPNLRRALDTALANGSAATAAELVAPRAQLVVFANQGFHGWADEILALPGVEDDENYQALVAIRAFEHHYAGRWRKVRIAADELLRADDTEPAAWWALWIAAWLTVMGGDRSEGLRRMELASESATQVGPDQLLLTRLGAVLASLTSPDPTGVEDPDMQRTIAVGVEHASPLMAGFALWCQSMLACANKDFEAMVANGQAFIEEATEDDQYLLPALIYTGWGQLGLGEYAAAIETADSLLDFGYRWGMPSEFLGALTIYALALQGLEHPTQAATIRGWLPGTFTFVFVEEMHALDRWLINNLDNEQLASLKDRGRSRTPRQLQQLAHEPLEGDR
ncbi:MAG: ATP-binding protein [Acidimicrobiales bacterium]